MPPAILIADLASSWSECLNGQIQTVPAACIHTNAALGPGPPRPARSCTSWTVPAGPPPPPSRFPTRPPLRLDGVHLPPFNLVSCFPLAWLPASERANMNRNGGKIHSEHPRQEIHTQANVTRNGANFHNLLPPYSLRVRHLQVDRNIVSHNLLFKRYIYVSMSRTSCLSAYGFGEVFASCL